MSNFQTLDHRINRNFLDVRSFLLAAVRGKTSCDLCIKNANLLNSFTAEVLLCDIWIKEGFIVFVDYHQERDLQKPPLPDPKNIYDARYQLVIPGFVDTHIHIESTMLTPDNLGKILAPLGTTTIFADPHEIVNVGGEEALAYMLESAESSPIRQYFLVPSCVPAVPSCENAGASLKASDINGIFNGLKSWSFYDEAVTPAIVGLAEVMDYIGIVKGDTRMASIVHTALKHGAFVQGHILGGKGRPLATYILNGIESNHENLTGDDIATALRHGFKPDIRLTSSLVSTGIGDLINNGVKIDTYASLCSVCTDDVHIRDILKNGHINRSVRALISNGVPPAAAVRMATLNAWNEYHVKRAGAIAEGYIADLQILPPQRDKQHDIEYSAGNVPEAVFVRGELIAKDGVLVNGDLYEKTSFVSQFESKNTVNGDFDISRFGIRSNKPKVKVNFITFVHPAKVITKLNSIAFPTSNGHVDISSFRGMQFVEVFNRYGLNHVGKAIIQSGMKGTLASTISHDSHNMTVAYNDIALAHKAVTALQKVGGGICYIAENGNEYLVPLEVGGLMSAANPAEIAYLYEALESAYRADNGDNANPMWIAVIALPVIPDVRISDLGIVDVAKQKIVPLFPD
jgi:adenine deaminase